MIRKEKNMQSHNQILKEPLTMEQTFHRFRERTKNNSSLKNKAEIISRELPEIITSVLKEAGDAMNGLVLLPGNGQKSQIGNPPGWHENPYHNNEYVFQISRMNHWLPMLYAYSVTGDEIYSKKIIDELTDWISNCPRPPIFDEDGSPRTGYINSPAAKEWRLLECGIRPYRTWCPVLEGLCDSPHFTAEVFESALYSLYEHCETVYRLSPLAWPKADHNHYLMENLGLLAVSCMFPELKDSEIWKNHAIKELCRCMEQQVDIQGAQIEGCPSYHNGCLFWFAMVLVYSRKYGFQLPESYRERFERMAVHSIYATRPNGTNVPWGDTSTLTGTLPKAAVCSYLGTGDRSFLSLCLNYYRYEDLLKEAEEQLWRMDDVGGFITALKESRPKLPGLPLLYYNENLKHVYFRTGWKRDDLSVMFACRSPIQNNHAHIDPCGFDFTAFGIPMAVDPGKYTYQDGPDRKNFKSMGWHNTLTINHQDAWEYISSWKYGRQKEGRITGCRTEGGLLWAAASHANYEPAIHTRALALVHGDFLMVIDVVEHLKPEDTVQIQFHIDRPHLCLKGQTATAHWDGDISLSVTSNGGSPALIPARISDRNDIYRDSTILQYQKSRPEETEVFLSVLCPAKGTPASVPQHVTVSRHPEAAVSFLLSGVQYSFGLTAHELKKL
ncbi:hypothetical protein GPL15_25730 [Clostridium sp. MCC353]|nr:hypothetical protein [Clostridium sp. MCC353]